MITYSDEVPVILLFRCKHLGKEIKRSAIKVNCGCQKNSKGQLHNARDCEKHNRCLPTFQPTEKQLEEWNNRKPESDIYHLCQNCEDFEPLEIA